VSEHRTGRLAAKVAIVVGAGIPGGDTAPAPVGAAIALRLAADGASVLAVDPEPGAAETTAQRAHGPGTVAPFLGHPSSVAEAEAVVGAAAERFGAGIHVLCTDLHAGLLGGSLDTSLERWGELLDRNVTTVYLAIRAVLPAMVGAGGGSIVAVTSSAGQSVSGLYSLGYSAAMAAVNQFCRLTAVDHAEDKVRCNVIVAGHIDDPRIYAELALGYGGDAAAARRAHVARVPAGRLGTPEEVAAVAAFLCGDEAHYVSGCLLPVDGGLSAQGSAPVPDPAATGS
jgi:NAD(P)-dependent dehydrogenase (short-subunit alcohol dehydrogenase family)